MDDDLEFSAYASARWGSLVRSSVFLGCSPHEAQDLVQATLMRCYAQWGKVSRVDDRDAYVYRILLNCHRDSRRRRWWGAHPTADLPETQSVDSTAAVDVADAVRRALGNLSKPNREVVVLRYFVHLSEQQTAQVLDIAPGVVKSRLSRALTQLSLDPQLTDMPLEVTS